MEVGTKEDTYYILFYLISIYLYTSKWLYSPTQFGKMELANINNKSGK